MNAIITGASSGIGWYFAKEIAQRGYDVILVARSKDKLTTLANEIEDEYNVRATVIVSDLSTKEGVNKLLPLAPTTDLLVNNAGFGLEHGVFDANLDKVRMMTKLNIEALTILTYGFIKAWEKRGTGRIVNISSMAAFLKSFPTYSAYAAGKDYVRKFTRSIRHDLEMQKSKIKINSIMPGMINTNFYNLDTNTNNSIKMTSPNKFAKFAIKATLDKNKKEVVGGKFSRIMKLTSRILPSKVLAKMITKILDKNNKLLT